MDAAWITNDRVTNVIVIDAENLARFTQGGAELLDTQPLGLAIGDFRAGGKWYRMVDGVGMELPITGEGAGHTPADIADMAAALALLGVEPGAEEGGNGGQVA